jgi:oligoendopeptidase F
MQTEMAQAAGKAFRQLTDADLKFGNVKDEHGNLVELSQATLAQFLYSPKRSVRSKASHQFYEQFAGHENTLAATLSGSIQKDIYYARARGHESARAKSLFADNMPASVYDSLITSVQNRLPALYRYYELRRRRMKLKEIHQYDTYVPILTELDTKRTWKQAVDVILKSLTPLGSEYCGALEKGLRGRWCDRYPNKGKRSGAFSSGSFDGDPYILMNYKPEVLDDVFTLTHEAGHSMHSYYSAKSQPYQYYSYTIFVAEVASTFNEQLLSHYLLENAKSDKERAYLINRDIDAIRGTIIRQTMFAEFEKITHEMAEAGEPLTLAAFKSVYRNLLELYFGPDFTLDDEMSIECLRIPHFYRAFYVYKYATGLSAAIALSQRVLDGGKPELNDYLGFLKGGCSKFPLDLLRSAGVDMEKPEPVDTALAHFESLVDQLDELL